MPNLSADFGTVTWHRQIHPFVHMLTCKTAKTRRELAGRVSSDYQVSRMSRTRSKREKELFIYLFLS